MQQPDRLAPRLTLAAGVIDQARREYQGPPQIAEHARRSLECGSHRVHVLVQLGELGPWVCAEVVESVASLEAGGLDLAGLVLVVAVEDADEDLLGAGRVVSYTQDVALCAFPLERLLFDEEGPAVRLHRDERELVADHVPELRQEGTGSYALPLVQCVGRVLPLACLQPLDEVRDLAPGLAQVREEVGELGGGLALADLFDAASEIADDDLETLFERAAVGDGQGRLDAPGDGCATDQVVSLRRPLDRYDRVDLRAILLVLIPTTLVRVTIEEDDREEIFGALAATALSQEDEADEAAADVAVKVKLGSRCAVEGPGHEVGPGLLHLLHRLALRRALKTRRDQVERLRVRDARGVLVLQHRGLVASVAEDRPQLGLVRGTELRGERGHGIGDLADRRELPGLVDDDEDRPGIEEESDVEPSRVQEDRLGDQPEVRTSCQPACCVGVRVAREVGVDRVGRQEVQKSGRAHDLCDLRLSLCGQRSRGAGRRCPDARGQRAVARAHGARACEVGDDLRDQVEVFPREAREREGRVAAGEARGVDERVAAHVELRLGEDVAAAEQDRQDAAAEIEDWSSAERVVPDLMPEA